MKNLNENPLYLSACILLLSVCCAFAEALCGDTLEAGKDLIFGGLVLLAFLISLWVYSHTSIGSRPDVTSMPSAESCEELLARKEAFAANILTIANPLAEPHDFASLPLYETERIIASGRYRLELVRSDNDKPVLVLCED